MIDRDSVVPQQLDSKLAAVPEQIYQEVMIE
jgi:hypothetical protein